MNKTSVELQPVLLLPKANISLWGNSAVTAVHPVQDSQSDEIYNRYVSSG